MRALRAVWISDARPVVYSAALVHVEVGEKRTAQILTLITKQGVEVQRES